MHPDPKYNVGQFVRAKVAQQLSESSVMDLDCEIIDRKWTGEEWEYKVTLVDAIFGDVANFKMTVSESELEDDEHQF